MATIVTRAGKGSPLTHDEVDDNFSNLNTDKVETSAIGTAAAADTGDFATAAQGTLADSAVQPNDSPTFAAIDVTGAVTADGLTVDGKIAAGDELGNANLSNTLDYTSSAGVAGYRPINLIDSSAGIKISRPNDGGDGAFIEFQEWDSTITTLISRAMLTGEGGDLLYRNLTTGGGDHIFQGEANAELMRIDASGKVGIGTPLPSEILHIQADDPNIWIDSTSIGEPSLNGGRSSNGGLLLTARNMNTTSKYTPAIMFGSTDQDFTTNNPRIGAAIAAEAAHTFSADTTGGMELTFWTRATSLTTDQAAVERMRIDSDGNVGIGTSSPDALFTVKGQTVLGGLVAGSPNLTNLTSGTPPQLIAGWSVPAISWSPASSTEAVFTRDGSMQVDILAGAGTFSNLNFSDPDDEDIGQISYDHSVDSMRFSTNGSEAMRIDSSGNVLIGTTTGNYALAVKDSGVDLALINQNDTIWTIGQNVVIDEFSIRDASAGATRLHIDSAGVVEITEGSVVLNGSAISAVQVTVADDAVAELTFTNRRFGMLNVVEGSNDDIFPAIQEVFLGYADFGNSAFGTTAIAGTETVLDTSNTLTGTTGTDGKFTIGLAGTSGTLYLENRRGATRTYNVTLL